jgi:perosamine synthetase
MAPENAIPLARPSFDEAEIDAVRRVMASGWVAGQGPAGAELESGIKELTQTEHAVALANCTAALHLAMIVGGVGPGDEVVVADYTYPATGHAVRYVGARPVFADVRQDIGTVDPSDVAAAITPRTVAIIGVDTMGQCADWDELRAIADRHGLLLVEDAACSAGATYRGRAAGSLADIACLSLHARKGITSGEGGLLVTNNRDWAERARSLAVFGTGSAFARASAPGFSIPAFHELGYNYKLSDIQAAVASVQLGKIDGFLARRRQLASLYGDALAETEGVTVPTVAEGRDHTWQTYAVRLADDIDRDQVAAGLRAMGIGCNIGTFSCHLQPVYDDPRECPVSASLYRSHLALPLFTEMTESDVERVVNGLEKAMAASR